MSNPPQSYNDPAGGTDSGIGGQLRTDYYQKKALIDAKREQFFGQLADTIAMPKHMGKKISRYHYLPLLNDANINDQGIDAAAYNLAQSIAGGTQNYSSTIAVTPSGVNNTGNGYVAIYAVADGSSAAAALAAAKLVMYDKLVGMNITGVTLGATYATAKTALTGAPAWIFVENAAVFTGGNLYGSSKTVGYIAGKMPALTEAGGKVNRVGFKRIELTGNLQKFGIYDEYTQESLDFDTDAELLSHINREMVAGANELTEDKLQIDLLSSAGVVRYSGVAASENTMTGNTGSTVSAVTYDDFVRLAVDLDQNRTPKNTKIITGTRMIDTKVVNAARYMYIGSELLPQLKNLSDNFNNQAFISVEKYAAGTTVAVGEVGAIDQFRIIVVPEMMHWEGTGASVGSGGTANLGYREAGGKYNVYPMMVVGSESFTTVGFQTSGSASKFKIKHSSPGSPESYANDPYGEKGFMSIKWYYGFMVLRPERIAIIKTLATQ